MRSALELDAEVRRLRRSMRRLVGLLTLALVVAVAVVVAVVSASLLAADKEAFQAFDGSARKAEAVKANSAKAKAEAARAESAKAEAAKASAAKDAHQPPARRTAGEAPAAPQQPAGPPPATTSMPSPAPARTAAAPEPQPAPAREAVGQAPPAAPPPPATTTAAAPARPAPEPIPVAVGSTPHPAVPDERRTAEPRKRHQNQVAHTRPTEDTESDADANSAATNPADRPRQEGDFRARSRHRRYVHVRPTDQERMRLPDDESDRVTVMTKRRPPAYAPSFEEPYRSPQVHRDRGWDGPFGLFGGLFGTH